MPLSSWRVSGPCRKPHPVHAATGSPEARLRSQVRFSPAHRSCGSMGRPALPPVSSSMSRQPGKSPDGSTPAAASRILSARSAAPTASRRPRPASSAAATDRHPLAEQCPAMAGRPSTRSARTTSAASARPRSARASSSAPGRVARRQVGDPVGLLGLLGLARLRRADLGRGGPRGRRDLLATSGRGGRSRAARSWSASGDIAAGSARIASMASRASASDSYGPCTRDRPSSSVVSPSTTSQRRGGLDGEALVARLPAPATQAAQRSWVVRHPQDPPAGTAASMRRRSSSSAAGASRGSGHGPCPRRTGATRARRSGR